MTPAEFIRRLKHQAEVVFGRYNCDVRIERANTRDYEVRIAPRAFDYYSVFIIDEAKMGGDDLHNAFGLLDRTLEDMIGNVFTNGLSPKRGYPKGIMDPNAKHGASL